MKRFARMLFAGLGIVIAASAISLAPHKAATAGGSAPVTVTNPSLPVTQSGPWNVGISGTPTVNVGAMPAVSINGTPTVNVGSMPAVSLAGTPTVNIGGSTGALSTQDLSTFASQNVMLQNRVVNSGTAVGLFTVSNTGIFSGGSYVVPNGQTFVVTSVDITPVFPGSGTNHVTLEGSVGTGAPLVFKSFEVSNSSSTHLDYHTGIAFGSNVQFAIFNGPLYLGDAPSAGEVDIFLQGYLTSN